jgi:hypothetical protein
MRLQNLASSITRAGLRMGYDATIFGRYLRDEFDILNLLGHPPRMMNSIWCRLRPFE